MSPYAHNRATDACRCDAQSLLFAKSAFRYILYRKQICYFLTEYSVTLRAHETGKAFPAKYPLECVLIIIPGSSLRFSSGNIFLLVLIDRFSKLRRLDPLRTDSQVYPFGALWELGGYCILWYKFFFRIPWEEDGSSL